MEQYDELAVSLKETAICADAREEMIVAEGTVILQSDAIARIFAGKVNEYGFILLELTMRYRTWRLT